MKAWFAARAACGPAAWPIGPAWPPITSDSKRPDVPCSAAGALSAQCAEATVAAIEPSTATPSAPPTCREALTTPEAMPARAGSTELMATPVVVGIVMETPAPTKMNDGKITVQ